MGALCVVVLETHEPFLSCHCDMIACPGERKTGQIRDRVLCGKEGKY